jgi:GDSL-like Lipase/Acylhydrolase family
LIASAAVALWEGWQFKGRDLANTAARRWREGQGGGAALVRHGGSIALRRVVAPLVSVAIAFLLAEGAARLVFRTVRSSGDARTFFATRVGEPNPLNNFGYRDVTIPPKSSRYRIVVIGDSITWGVGLSEPERYTNVMQQRLGDAYEVFNFGIPGHNMPEHLQTLGPALSTSPDFILLQLYTNDFETENMERPRARPLLPWRGADAWLLRSSAVYTMLAAQWPRIQEKVGLTETYERYMYRYLGDPQSPESQRSFGMLHRFIATAHDAGVPTGAVMFPNPGVLGRDYAFDYLHDRVQGVCAEEHVRCVDLRKPFLSSFTDLKEIVVSPFDGHPSARASVVAADAILSAFEESWRRRGDPPPGHQ